MMISYADWKKPTDAAYAFQLRGTAASAQADAFLPEVPASGTRSDIRAVVREVLGDEEAQRFERRIQRWSGPEDVVGGAGETPYAGLQLHFEEFAGALSMEAVDEVLRGTVLVLRGAGGQVDYVLRDHHMLDVALYHYRTTGELPDGLFHADRHSDWCKDSLLETRTPDQAATWWKLLHGLKRPGGAVPVLEEEQVFFATAQAAHEPWMSGRDVGASVLMPWFLGKSDIHWAQALARPGATEADWVSLDLDYFQPSPQLALTKGLLRDRRFHALVTDAKVRVFVLSPQFTNGGDKIAEWMVNGRMHSSLRLLHLLRDLPGRVRVEG